VERFSGIEKQKLAELLVTNKDLLQNIFDKMFRNKEGKDDKMMSKGSGEIGADEILNMLKGDFGSQPQQDFRTQQTPQSQHQIVGPNNMFNINSNQFVNPGLPQNMTQQTTMNGDL
jgi:hypothetical protein